MPDTVWKPHLTVAAIVQQGQRFLMVREIVGGKEQLNQPAGHLEPGETVLQAVSRETLEETGYQAESMELLLSSPTSAGMTSEITHLFLATNLQKVAAGGGVGGEDIRVHHVPLKLLPAWLSEQKDRGLLVDSKIHASLWLAGQRDHGLQ